MIVLHDPLTLKHDTVEFLGAKTKRALESPERITAILKAIAAKSPQHQVCQVQCDAPLSYSHRVLQVAMRAAHDFDYLNYLRDAHKDWVSAGIIEQDESILPECFRVPTAARRQDIGPPKDRFAKAGYYAFDMSTGICKDTFQAAMASAYVAVMAVISLTTEGHAPTVLSLCRPPGHHCTRNMAGGYCYINNMAVAVYALMVCLAQPEQRKEWSEAAFREPSIVRNAIKNFNKKVAILDLDFHHGNGTQDAFYDTDVLYISIHGEDEFPYYSGREDETGVGEGTGYTCNLPLKVGASFEEYMEKLNAAIGELEHFKPDYLFVSLGFDTFHLDPLGKFQIDTEHYSIIAKTIRSAKALVDVPTAILLEGGYVIDRLGANMISFMQGWEDAETDVILAKGLLSMKDANSTKEAKELVGEDIADMLSDAQQKKHAKDQRKYAKKKGKEKKGKAVKDAERMVAAARAGLAASQAELAETEAKLAENKAKIAAGKLEQDAIRMEMEAVRAKRKAIIKRHEEESRELRRQALEEYQQNIKAAQDNLRREFQQKVEALFAEYRTCEHETQQTGESSQAGSVGQFADSTGQFTVLVKAVKATKYEPEAREDAEPSADPFDDDKAVGEVVSTFGSEEHLEDAEPIANLADSQAPQVETPTASSPRVPADFSRRHSLEFAGAASTHSDGSSMDDEQFVDAISYHSDESEASADHGREVEDAASTYSEEPPPYEDLPMYEPYGCYMGLGQTPFVKIKPPGLPESVKPNTPEPTTVLDKSIDEPLDNPLEDPLNEVLDRPLNDALNDPLLISYQERLPEDHPFRNSLLRRELLTKHSEGHLTLVAQDENGKQILFIEEEDGALGAYVCETDELTACLAAKK